MSKVEHNFIGKIATESHCDENLSSISHIGISCATSNKGKQILIHENYVFKCNKTTASKRYSYCSEREYGVYIHTNATDELVCVTGLHHHPADPDQLAVIAVERLLPFFFSRFHSF